jgi:Uma2 family endonuclease
MERSLDPRLLTEQDLARLPDDGFRHELQAGLLLAEPSLFPLHAQVQARIIELLAGFVRAHHLGQVLGDGGFLLASNPDTVRGPDVSFVNRDRWSAVTDRGRFLRGAPDLAVEILSPSNRSGEIHAKVADYLAAGAPLVRIVDPKRRMVTIHETLLAPRRLGARDVLDGGDVLPGFAIPVEEFFEG